jgi:5-methylcytosine-specific restriction endonuclease McrA
MQSWNCLVDTKGRRPRKRSRQHANHLDPEGITGEPRGFKTTNFGQISDVTHEVDHVIAEKHGGKTAQDNLALALLSLQ